MSMTAKDIPGVARTLLDQHGLQDWTFRWDQSKRRAGLYRHFRKTISLSVHYVVLNIADRFDDILDTILHEIAHALAGPRAKHGPEWKAVCEQIGARPERCYDSDVITMPRGNWVAVCEGCNREYHRHHEPRVTNGYYRCAKCGPDIGRLRFQYVGSIPTAPVTTSVNDTTPPVPKRLRG